MTWAEYPVVYEPARTDGHSCTQGARACRDAIEEIWPATQNVGCYVYRPVTGGTSLSLHAEGRAWDTSNFWPGDDRYPEAHEQLVQATRCLVWGHKYLGCQQVIFNHEIWRNTRAAEGWRGFDGGNGGPHEDHAHGEITKAAAAGLTKAVALEVLLAAKAALFDAPPPESPPEDDMILIRWQCIDADAAFFGWGTPDGVCQSVEWCDQEAEALYGPHFKSHRETEAWGFRNLTLVGRMPVGDRFKEWSADNFRQWIPAA